MDIDGEDITDRLSSAAREWCRSVGSKAETVSEVMKTKDAAVFKEIQAGIDRANDKAISHAQRIQKWQILLRDFSIQGGELGKKKVTKCRGIYYCLTLYKTCHAKRQPPTLLNVRF